MLLTRSSGSSLSQQVYSILQKYGTDAHVYLPGIGVINGLTAGNYLDSAGTTAATVDNPVGLVVDSGGINAIQATTANKPILRRGAVNLLTYSEQFDNAAWSKSNATVTANAVNAPDGTLTADKLIESAAASRHEITRSAITGIVAGTSVTFSIMARAEERSAIVIFFGTGEMVDNAYAIFDLSSGTVHHSAGGVAAITIEANGFYRVSLKGVAALTTATPFVGLLNALSTSRLNSYTGDGTSGLYVWGAQLETGSTASTYIPTTTAAASSPSGNYHWVHDSTDVLTATFPAGYESATTINASTAGQSTLTAQNIVGAYNIGPSIDTYGRFVFKTITASELAIVQSYCNRLAGV